MTSIKKLARTPTLRWGLGLVLGLVLAQAGLGFVEGLVAGFTNGV